MFKGGFRSKKKAKPTVAPKTADEEKGAEVEDSSASSEQSQTEKEMKALQRISTSESVYTWRDVCYSVPTPQGQKQLLNHIDGYAKPGIMIALMGASGAGKTTLLNTLSRRAYGVVSGEMLVDGKERPTTFQRSTGFCEQMDIHDTTATIREALEFSAILRQDRNTPKAEKLAYVDTVIDLLELNEIQDAVIMSLNVEQRKRLTIGVELAAKPQLLLFLDEPTSGLDSQSAFQIIRFLKKLSAAGQAIVCTIHQPSTILIQQFDKILALNPGGNTFYFGDVGDQGSAVVKYFADRGFQCPPGKNIAEFILEVAAKVRRRADGSKVDWNQEWKSSEEAQSIKTEIEAIKSSRIHVPDISEGMTPHEYAAPIWSQTVMLTQRLLRQYWRSPSYYYGRLFTCVIVGIFNGFTFWQLGFRMQDMTNRMFTAFLILTIPPTVVNAVVPKFFMNMMVWQAREFPSRVYGWVAFVTAQVVGEIPISLVGSFLYWVLWYWATGLPQDSSTAGYSYLMTMLFFLFMSSWGQWITAFAPSFTVISNVLPFFFVMFTLFNGVVRPYSALPVFWRYWMYYVNPSTYWISGMLAATLKGIPVECAVSETAQFTPPPGQTCQQYAGAYASQAGGHLLPDTVNSTTLCQYCQLSSGDQFLASLNISPGDKWRDFGIFLVFVATNYMLVYFFIWSCRIKHYKFGLGYVFGAVDKIFAVVFWPVKWVFGNFSKKA